MNIWFLGRKLIYKPNQYEDKTVEDAITWFSVDFNTERNIADLLYKRNTIDSEESLLGFNLFGQETIEFFEIQQEKEYEFEDYDPNLAFIV